MDKLRQIAEAATPGPWQNGIEDLEGVVAPHNPGLGNVICIPPLKRMYSSLERWPDNARFIATFNPAKVLELLAALQAAEARALAVEGVLRDEVVGAFIAGAFAIHKEHDPDDRDPFPEFGEAASDYADQALSHQKAQELGSLESPPVGEGER